MLQNLGFLFGLFWKKKGLWTNIEQLKTLQWYTILANKRYLALECCLFMSASIVINLSLGSFRAVLSETWTGPEGCKPCGCGSWRNGSERVSAISKFYNLPWWRGKIGLLNKHLWNKCHGFLMTFISCTFCISPVKNNVHVGLWGWKRLMRLIYEELQAKNSFRYLFRSSWAFPK